MNTILTLKFCFIGYYHVRDIFSVLRDPACLRNILDLMVAKIELLKWTDVDVVVGLESRGFILAPLLAVKLNAGFVPVRKKGRLPGVCKEIAYTLEYRSVSPDSLFKFIASFLISVLIFNGFSFTGCARNTAR